MTSANPKISVIIPCYNREGLIGETLETVLQQTLKPYEVIVVDDGSTDDSAKVVELFGGSVRLIRQANQGPGTARNTGFAASSGELIQFMDSDDLMSHNKLEIQSSALAHGPYDFAYCPWVRCIIANKTITFLDKVLQQEALPSTKPMLEWFVSGWSLVFQNCLFKRSLIERTGGYRRDLMPSEDSEYFVRILLSGAKGIHTPGCLIFYREHHSNKITGQGTNENLRATDWTKYLDITGSLLNGKLNEMQLGTKLAIADHVRRHQQYCGNRNMKGLNPANPYNHIRIPFKKMIIPSYGIYRRIRQKISNSTDYNTGFRPGMPTTKQFELADQIGYKALQS